jgi:hypothetical protein
MTFFEKLFDFLKFASNFSTVVLTINMVLFTFLAFKSKEKTIIILALYLMTIFCVQNYGAWLAFNGINNLFGTHYYFILQLLWLAYFYHEICSLPVQNKIIRYSILGCLIVLAIQYGLKPELYLKINELEVFLCSYLLIIFALFHFYNLLGTGKKYLFFSIGLFVYLFGSTILFLVGNLNLILNLNRINSELNRWLYSVFQLLVLFEAISLLNTYKILNINPKFNSWKILRMPK